jgi:hypothetical protein
MITPSANGFGPRFVIVALRPSALMVTSTRERARHHSATSPAVVVQTSGVRYSSSASAFRTGTSSRWANMWEW